RLLEDEGDGTSPQPLHLAAVAAGLLELRRHVEQVLQLGRGEVELLEEVTPPQGHATHGSAHPLSTGAAVVVVRLRRARSGRSCTVARRGRGPARCPPR